jgi:hypothetical protein
MQTRKYSHILIATVVILLSLIAFISFALYTQGPRVRLVTFEKDISDTALHRNSGIKLTFDRPLENKNYTKQIRFEPEISFSAQTSSQSIQLLLEDNFMHNTEYSLLVDTAIFDKTGKPMREKYVYRFTTGAPKYAYIERNYSSSFNELSNASDDENDHLFLATVGGATPEKIFSAPIIVSYAINNQYAVIVTREENTDSLHTINLDSKEVRKENLRFSAQIEQVTLSPRGTTALFIVTPDYSKVGKEYYEQFANQIESLNVETGELTQLVSVSGDNIRGVSIELNDNGQVALLEDIQQKYYAISPFNDYEPILIGSRTDTFGFNYDSSEIYFRDNFTVSQYDIASGDTLAYDFKTNDFIQGLESTSEGIFYFATTFSANQSRSYVTLIDNLQDTTPTEIWSTTREGTDSLRGLSLSYDSSILGLQVSPNNCRNDGIAYNSQCSVTYSILYDRRSNEEITQIRGFDILWLP